MKRAARRKTGSLIFDKQRGTWRYLEWIDGRRRSRTIGTRQRFSTKSSAWDAVERLLSAPQEPKHSNEVTVKTLTARYEAERFPARHDTARVYRSFLKCHILPQWGDQPLSAIKPYEVEKWLGGLALSPKSRTHVRALMYALFEFAMFAGVIELGRNPISLVRNTGASRKIRQTRNLTIAEFQGLVNGLPEPFATLALCCACLGLRISEGLGLQWRDVDWLGGQIAIRRSIVAQVVDAPKTQGSEKSVSVASELLQRLQAWKQATQFSSDTDWIFASPVKLGRKPFSYTGTSRIIRRSADAAGIGKVTTHAFRHSFRSWLGAEGVPLAIQKELMRHSTIGMTLRYGTTFDAQLKDASSKIADLVFANGSRDGSQTS
jgi:integrase